MQDELLLMSYYLLSLIPFFLLIRQEKFLKHPDIIYDVSSYNFSKMHYNIRTFIKAQNPDVARLLLYAHYTLTQLFYTLTQLFFYTLTQHFYTLNQHFYTLNQKNYTLIQKSYFRLPL